MSDLASIGLLWGAATHRGARRRLNEDSYLAGGSVFFVADGMGGHEAGEVASAAAVEALRPLVTAEVVGVDDVRCRVRTAHDAVRRIETAPGRGAGTTLTGVALTAQGGEPYWLVVNLGDSRTYRLADGELEQVSVDHSEVQELVDAGSITRVEAQTHPRRHVVTRALGAPEIPDADFWFLPVHAGDRLLVCSDGLTGELSDARIALVLLVEADPQAAADRLVREALEAGGRDNITVVVVDASGLTEALESTAPRDGHADHQDEEDTVPRRSPWRGALT
ncbi:protein phosphatase [Isoptericola sp. CG 20/1183]|uniref:Protein phosphatase n=1 Tax=Isoptericola halotolerans TaxID=300560 RepID=A0ABX5EJ54_9MICO|nr:MULTISPECIES: protein phosphatase 2C domain-containing protein [Isoptericola]MCK0118046.1 protein phosphatase 2C domain-containing protein [Isoptericola sp. S6320L]PRZ09716.1 protein phosphatase [Isoptericola sp. CG 20/1183]PRZ10517.1 protein phosphatase [Isoptericola halotolerans]